MLELVLLFESDVKSVEQVITKARNFVNDSWTLTVPGNHRSFASDAWTMYDKVCIYLTGFMKTDHNVTRTEIQIMS